MSTVFCHHCKSSPGSNHCVCKSRKREDRQLYALLKSKKKDEDEEVLDQDASVVVTAASLQEMQEAQDEECEEDPLEDPDELLPEGWDPEAQKMMCWPIESE